MFDRKRGRESRMASTRSEKSPAPRIEMPQEFLSGSPVAHRPPGDELRGLARLLCGWGALLFAVASIAKLLSSSGSPTSALVVAAIAPFLAAIAFYFGSVRLALFSLFLSLPGAGMSWLY